MEENTHERAKRRAVRAPTKYLVLKDFKSNINGEVASGKMGDQIELPAMTAEALLKRGYIK